MAIELTDDGTLDTVLRCSDCGEEMRYNYDGEGADLTRDDTGCYKVDNLRFKTEEQANAHQYDAFVDWAIEDAEDSHECPRYSVQTWFERDRAHVALYFGTSGDANDTCIVEWWDEAVQEAVEDGFLNPRDYLSSALAYARSVGLA